MTNAERRKFSTVHDWYNFINELAGGQIQGSELYNLRRGCYSDIENERGRPLLVYAVKYPEAPADAPIQLGLDDVDGFTDLLSAVGDADEVDILIHSPGGVAEATERIVSLLRNRFTNVCFLVPHSAYSAATMLALSGNEIILHPSATLGPIDPQIGGVPARSIRRGFDKVRELLKEEGPEALPAYVPLLEKLTLQMLELCDDSLKLSQELVKEWLAQYMFGGQDGFSDIIEKAVQYFSDYDIHKTHGRPLTLDKINPLGLKIRQAEPPIRELMWEAHILLYGFFGITPFVKLFENNNGLSWGKQFRMLPGPGLGSGPQLPQ